MRVKIILAFASIYLIWGSTYLAIKIAIQTLPPLIMGGLRFFTAGIILYFWKKLSGVEKENFKNWRSASALGALYFLGGNGAVIIGIHFIPSGLTALIIATCPIWMVILDYISHRQEKPGIAALIGLALGMLGLVLLFNPLEFMGRSDLHLGGALIILCGTFCWSFGAVYAKSAPLPKSRTLSASMQMISGGILLFLAGLVSGELAEINFNRFSTESSIAFIYLIGFGSIIGFSAFNWLLNVTSMVKVSTYAFVNPIVALILGATLASESLSIQSLVAASVIIVGVMLITMFKKKEIIPETAPEVGSCMKKECLPQQSIPAK